jgi:hypothetical protein
MLSIAARLTDQSNGVLEEVQQLLMTSAPGGRVFSVDPKGVAEELSVCVRYGVEPVRRRHHAQR